MSDSSYKQLSSCEQKYVHRKVLHTAVDSDIDTDKKHFRIGSCFHEILELCLHDVSNIDNDTTYACFERHRIDSDQDRGLILAMVRKYGRLHKGSGLKVIACEDEIGDEYTIGYIDAVMVDRAGFYYIVDLKTASRFDGNLVARLKRDSQLNLYSYFRSQIESKYCLSPENFAGALYRVTEKSSRVKKASESVEQFASRVIDYIESYSIFIPASELDPKGAYLEVRRAQAQATALSEGKVKPKRNYNKCFEYFSPCEYYSNCYGFLNSDADSHFKIETSKNIKEMLQMEPELMDVL